jgi:hypothetical protein
MSKKYLEIIERIKKTNISICDLEGDLNQVISTLITIRDNAANLGYYNISIEPDYEYDGVELFGTRLETDKEREKRLAKAKKEREANKELKKEQEKEQEKEERELYEKLKKKFEGKK